MKKFFSLLLAMPLLMLFATSCDDDNNMPDVDVFIKISGATNIDGTLYTVQGDTLSIDSIGVTNREQGKAAIITSATYSWDYRLVGTNPISPFGMNLDLIDVPAGAHLLQITCPLFAVDKSAAQMYMAYKVVVVEDESQLPSDEGATEFLADHSFKEN